MLTVRPAWWWFAVPLAFLLAFLAALAWGFHRAWDEVVKGMAQSEFGFLQNLLSEGLGVVVTLLLITPLTAFYVHLRERREREPLQRELLLEFARRLRGVTRAFEQIHRRHIAWGAELLRADSFTVDPAIDLRLRSRGGARSPAEWPRLYESPKGRALRQHLSLGEIVAEGAERIAALADTLGAVETATPLHAALFDANTARSMRDVSLHAIESLRRFDVLARYASGSAEPADTAALHEVVLDGPGLLQKAHEVIRLACTHHRSGQLEAASAATQQAGNGPSIAEQQRCLADIAQAFRGSIYGDRQGLTWDEYWQAEPS